MTTVPAQALAMMNSPFIHQQVSKWGQSVYERPGSTQEKIGMMFEKALGREPSKTEFAALIEVAAMYSNNPLVDHGTPQVFASLGHVILNTADFIFID